MFNRPSFSPVSFSQISFNGYSHVVPQTDERSGYWRLFFMNMQEEALKKRDAVLVPKPNEEPDEQIEREAAPQRARKAAPRKPTVVEPEEFPEVRFKRKPIYATAKPVNEKFPLWVYQISAQIDSWYASYLPLLEASQKVIIEQRAAANDADIRMRLLLLAA
jgi:hypothetical protein